MTDIDPAAAIRAGLGAPDAPGAARRARRIAADFQRNETYDRLLELRDNHDPRWVDAGRSVQLACAMYADQRDIAAAHGTDTTPTP